ncbi:YIP1 family protein [Deinococcus radiotolerans]|uniref:YIP1 family protein n=1 Tax=Deinococcus radiotolerans TaxID=1309407 RepID=A0ABQ2FHK6_9DEIO|nr:YIP1 family protein [Deinococcus radiotolerans]GGK92731.1 YIP1 family protein [Deinococcus radiotolerans]
MTSGPESNVQDMFAQSVAVLSRPSPATFERFERRGGLTSALTYVMIAAVVSAVIAALFSFLHSDVTFFGQLFSRLITIPLGFAAFTGAVYLIGRGLFKGTGTYPEVAYSFALFYVPLSIVSTLLGIIPILGWLIMLAVSLIMIYFGFLAVQSSMNLRDQTQAIVTLVLAWIAQLVVAGVIGSIIGGLFVAGRVISGN